MKIKIKSYQIFQIEIKNLINFYMINSSFLLRIEDEKIWNKKAIKKRSKEIENLLTFDIDSSKNKTRGFRMGLIFRLRELLFVRIISALEVFLIDSIKDVFKINKAPFLDNSLRYNLSQSELLSITTISEIRNKILTKETRALSSGGLKEIVKYYKKRFNIDLYGINPGKEKINKFHEMRHLLVHKLGKTDKGFRIKYETKDFGLSIDELILFEMINDLSEFASIVKLRLEKFIELQSKKTYNRQSNSDGKTLTAKIKFNQLNEKELFFINPKFEFWVGDELRLFEEIESSINKSGKKIIVLLKSDHILLKSYLNVVRSIFGKSKKYRHLDVKLNPNTDKNISNANFENYEFDELVVLVKDNLPTQPWRKGIHKEIAKKINASNSKVSRVIKYLINLGEFKKQNNGMIEE